MKKKQCLAMLLAALLCSASLTACGQGTPQGDTDAQQVEETAQPETEETQPEWALEAQDFGGSAVTFFLRITGDDWSADDVVAEEMNGKTINDAVYTRNTKIEDACNVKIVGNEAPLGHYIHDPVVNSILAADNAFDVIASNRYDAANLMTEGVLQNLQDMEYLHLDQSWWNPFYSAEASIGGKLYYALGDISRVWKLGVRCLFFNKDLAEELQISNLYDTVAEGNWDYDTFFATAALANIDLDGDGSMGDDDCYGIQAQSSLGVVMATGGGMQIVGKDEEDMPALMIQTEFNQSLLESLSTRINTNKDSIYYSDNWQNTQKRFASGQVLFQAEVMLLLEALRAEEVNVGVLPMPKATVDQETYISYLDSHCQNVYSLPTTCTTVDMVSYVLEAMAQGSLDTLNPAFYDICLNGKYIRDEESSAMLDIIFDYCRTESSETFGWGGLYSKINDAIYKGTVASAIQSGTSSTEAAIQKTVDQILTKNSAN